MKTGLLVLMLVLVLFNIFVIGPLSSVFNQSIGESGYQTPNYEVFKLDIFGLNIPIYSIPRGNIFATIGLILNGLIVILGIIIGVSAVAG